MVADKREEVRFTQLVVGQWRGNNEPGLNHMLYGLTDKGEVYRQSKAKGREGWVKISMRVVSGKPNEKFPNDNGDF